MRKFGQPEFVFSVDDGLLSDADVQWFRSALEGMVAAGEKFKAGQTLLVGPVLLRLEAAEGGRLRVLEPDMKSMPFKYVPSVSNTINMVRRQRYTADSLGATRDISFAPLHLPLLVTQDALKAPMILMMRNSREGMGTGWVLSDAQSKRSLAEEKLQAVSVYEAVLQRPELVDFLALPDQFSVLVVSRKQFSVFKDGKPVEPAAGSYLDRLAKPAQ